MPERMTLDPNCGMTSAIPLIPNHARIRGTQARGGMGRSISTVESKNFSAVRK